MGFEVAATAYDRFMGRFSGPLGERFLDWVGVPEGARVLDVGCGPGTLTRTLVDRLGAGSVLAVDPSASFVAAATERLPGVLVQRASAEDLPFDDDQVDLAVAQLVVHFMTDPVAGLREMARVTWPGGVVAADVWDYAGDRGPLSPFWRAVARLDADAPDESGLAGVREGHLVALLEEAGLVDVEGTEVATEVAYADFDDWWEPFTFGVGPAGAHLAGLDEAARAALREECLAEVGESPVVRGVAWAARGTVPG